MCMPIVSVVHATITYNPVLVQTASRGSGSTSYCACNSVGCSALRQAVLKAETYEPGTVQQLQFLAACINANAHATGHLDDTNTDSGLGVYPVLSMFNHSCCPNLAHSSEGTAKTQASCKSSQIAFQPREICRHVLHSVSNTLSFAYSAVHTQLRLL